MKLSQKIQKQITGLSIKYNSKENFTIKKIEKSNVNQEVRNCESYSLFHFDIAKFIRLSRIAFAAVKTSLV